MIQTRNITPYEAPRLEAVRIHIEHGFAGSDGLSTGELPDFGEPEPWL